MKNGVKNVKSEERMEELIEKYEEKVSTKNLSIMEQNIHDRGVSSGYFKVYAEEIIDMTNRNQILYLQGRLKGEQKRKRLLKRENGIDPKIYLESRKAYLRNLGSLAAKGIIIIDESELNEAELKDFYEGYNIENSLSSSKTLNDIILERKKHKNESADDVLETRRSVRIRSIEM